MESGPYVTAVDPGIFDRALIQYLLVCGTLRSLNTLKVFLILLWKCEWSMTYFDGNVKWPTATITNNGKLRLTGTEASETYGISHSAFYKAIADLIDRGLVKIAKRGYGGGNLYEICAPRFAQTVNRRFKAARARTQEMAIVERIHELQERGLVR